MLKVFSVEHASSKGPAVMEEGGEGNGSCSVAKQAVEFPQVLKLSNIDIIGSNAHPISLSQDY